MPISHIDYTNAFDCVDHSKLWKTAQEIGIPDHITCLLRSLEQVKQQLELDMKQWTGSKLWKDYWQSCILSPCLFNLYAEYIMQNAGLDEVQVGIKIARRNINSLRYADVTTLTEKVKRN